MEALRTFDSYRDLPRIGATTLVATGAHDVLVKPRNSEILASRIPNARLELLADLGHRAIWEAPEEMADLIGDFLTGPIGWSQIDHGERRYDELLPARFRAVRTVVHDRRHAGLFLRPRLGQQHVGGGSRPGPQREQFRPRTGRHLAPAIEAIRPEDLDIAALGARTAIAGVPTIPFVQAVQARLSADLERSFHKGATTQDIIDTALVLLVRDALT